jgi:signal transduction histidine kinase
VSNNNSELLKLLDEAINSEALDRTVIQDILKQSKKRINRFDTIVKQSDKQLSEQVRRLENEFELRINHERILAQQAKLAAMGEMMDAVAHQWKQSLNIISMLTDILVSEYKDGDVDEAYLEEYRMSLWKQLDHLLNTLDEFRSFFRPDKEKSAFNLSKSINAVLLLIKDEFIGKAITFNVEGDDNIELYGVENEFKHIVLNILNNAKDAFIENEIKPRTIKISFYQKEGNNIMEICDNAGGIPDIVIDNIFKANVITKAEGKGTGIGLYMSAQIAEKMDARLEVQNKEEGACFIFIVSESKEELK